MTDDTTTDNTTHDPVDPTELTISELEDELESGDFTAEDLQVIRTREGGDEDGRKGALEAIDGTEPTADTTDTTEPDMTDDTDTTDETTDGDADTVEADAEFTRNAAGDAEWLHCPACAKLNDIKADECTRCEATLQLTVTATGGAA